MSWIFDVIEIIGVIAFAVAGSMMAIDREADFFGVLFCAFMTCFGGGVMRDLFIGGKMPAFFTDYHLETAVCAATSILVFFLAKFFKRVYIKREKLVDSIVNIFDALGLGIFVVYSTGVAIAANCSAFASIVIGMTAGTGGGLIRDLVLRDIPIILRKRIYAVAAIVGAAVYYVIAVYLSNELLATSLGLSVVFALRVCATVFKWNMPKAIVFSEVKLDGDEGN
ncbi:MAG: trimeric intracellular cation channel family protein [Clostridia bacterium]|nr:trimeric intracellular cation channel family protein [Clostridia bacterium]MBQ8720139.1 trimeric intracellular cation channel family protein [Clostridia bacterium]